MKILIVDDSKAMRMIVKRTLREAGFADHATVDVADGAEGLAALAREPFDLVLCDWNMPVMNGLEMLQAVRSKGLTIHFGFVTSEGTDAIRDRAKAAGASFLIVKPFTREDFTAALSGVLQAGA